MEIAKNAKQNIVNAMDANYGIYFCAECSHLVYLRKPKNKAPHFYHFRYNTNCSYCIQYDENIWNKNLITSLNAVEIIKKNSTPENWFMAIECLINNNHLYLLEGHDWCITPVSLYINNHIEQITPEDFFKLVLVLVNNKSIRCSNVLFNTIDNPKLSLFQQLNIIEAYTKNCLKINDEVAKNIVNKNLNIEIVYMIFPYLTKGKQNEILKQSKYKAISYLRSLLDPSITYQQCLLNFRLLIIQDKQSFLSGEWSIFLNMLRSNIVEMNNESKNKLIEHIDKELLKAKYFVGPET